MRRREIVRRIGRRTLLKSALGAAVSLPWLEAMAPRVSHAQDAAPKRFGVFFSGCGTIPENWTPNGTETDFTLSPILEPLTPHQSDIIVLEGVDMKTTEIGPIANVHDMGVGHMLAAMPVVMGPAGAGRANHFLDGSAGGITIDQAIASAVGGDTLLPSLELGVECNSTFLEVMVTRISYRGVNQPVIPVDNPVQVFTRMFGSAENQGDTAAMLNSLRNRQSVLDFVTNDYVDLSRRLGAADKARIDQHLTDVRSIEERVALQLDNPELGACPQSATLELVEPSEEQCLRDQDLRTDEELANQEPNFCVGNFREVGQLQLDLMALAYICDVSRVASIQWSTGESTTVMDWLDLQYQGTIEHHMLTHNESVEASTSANNLGEAETTVVRQDLTKIHNWYASQFAYLIQKLKDAPEGDGSVLDNCLLYWTNELGEGGLHTYTNVPYVLAGGAGGALQTGRYLSFLGGTRPAHNQLYVSFQNLFGIDSDEFGYPDFKGPLPRLV